MLKNPTILVFLFSIGFFGLNSRAMAQAAEEAGAEADALKNHIGLSSMFYFPAFPSKDTRPFELIYRRQTAKPNIAWRLRGQFVMAKNLNELINHSSFPEDLEFFSIPADHKSRLILTGLALGREYQYHFTNRISATVGQDLFFVRQHFQSWIENRENSPLSMRKLEIYGTLFGGLIVHLSSKWYLHYELSYRWGQRSVRYNFDNQFTKLPEEPLQQEHIGLSGMIMGSQLRNALFLNYLF